MGAGFRPGSHFSNRWIMRQAVIALVKIKIGRRVYKPGQEIPVPVDGSIAEKFSQKIVDIRLMDDDGPMNEKPTLLMYRGRDYWCNKFTRCIPQSLNPIDAKKLQKIYPDKFVVIDTGKGLWVGPNATVGNFEREIMPELKNIKNPRVLIIRDMGAGDILLSIPAVRALRKKIPTATIHYATQPRFFQLLEGVNEIDALVSVHDLNFKKSKYNFVINWARAVEDYGISRNKMHRAEAFAAHIGIRLYERKIEFKLTKKYRVWACRMLPGEKPRIGIVMRACGWNRSYPAAKWPVVAKEIKKKYPKAEIVLIDNEKTDLSGRRIKNMTGKTPSFLHAAALMARCSAIITPDTGLAHIAGILKIPTLILQGSIPAEVRFSDYPKARILHASSRVECSPCWDHRFYDPLKSSRIMKECVRGRANKCMDFEPIEIVKELARVLEGELGIMKPATESYSLIVPFHVTEENIQMNKTYLNGIINNNPAAEIIIVDNGSCARWRILMKNQRKMNNLKIISERNSMSYSAACNRGARESTKENLCFLNSDVAFGSDVWAAPFLARLKNDSVGIVGASGRKLRADNWCGDVIQFEGQVDYIEGWCVFMRRAVYDRAGGWNEEFKPFYFEDADLSFTVSYSLKLRLELIPRHEQYLEHIGGSTIKTNFRTTELERLEKNAEIFRNKWGKVFSPGAGFYGDTAVAILIPAHVKEAYLIQCLDSLKEISRRNIGVYVGLDRMKFKHKAKYPFIKFIDMDFGSVNHVRNALIRASIEPLIYFLDADNFIYPGAIEKFKYELLRSGADVAYSQARILDESKDHWFDNQTDGLLNTYPFDPYLLRERNYIDMGSMVRRSALPSGEPFDVENPMLHDWDLWLDMMASGKKFHYIEEPLFAYRIHDSNLTKKKNMWDKSIARLRAKHGSDIGGRKKHPRVSLVTIAKTQAEIDEKKEELKNQTAQIYEFCTSTHPDLARAWVEAFSKVTGDVVVVNECDAHITSNHFIEDLLKELRPGEIIKGMEMNHQWENFANTAFHADLLKRHPVTAKYGIAQDTEWFIQCKANSGRVRHIQGAAVIHERGIATEKQKSRAYDYGRLHTMLIKKYGYFPLEQLVKRHKLQKEIAERNLQGIEDELNAPAPA